MSETQGRQHIPAVITLFTGFIFSFGLNQKTATTAVIAISQNATSGTVIFIYANDVRLLTLLKSFMSDKIR